MQRIRLSTDWKLNPMDPYQFFLNPEAGGKPEKEIMLPFDALLLEKRDPEVSGGRDSGFYPPSICTYMRKIEAPREWEGKRIILEFEGVYKHGMVYVNGAYAGGCPHGYTEFSVDISPFLKYGNVNEIKVTSKQMRDSRWYPGMGIYRYVNLLIGEDCHITEYGHRITTVAIDSDGAAIEVESEVENISGRSRTIRVETYIRDADDKEVSKNGVPLTLYPGERRVCRQKFYIKNARLWDTSFPYLYTAKTLLMDGDENLDSCQDNFGIRVLTLDAEHGLAINGNQVKLRGACIHHDNGIIGSAAIDRAEERKVELLKKAGFNAIRSAHNPISRSFLEACDRVGLLVMDELTDMWHERKGEYDYSTEFDSHWRSAANALVDKDYNHPSVIMYSIGNEIPESGSIHGAHQAKDIAEYIKGLDSRRYTIDSVNLLMACMSAEKDEIVSEQAAKDEMDINQIMSSMGTFMDKMLQMDSIGRITEETFAAVDIAGYNYASVRYEKDHMLYPGRIICGSETFPAKMAENWKLVEKHPYIIGDFTWTGWDYLGEAGIGMTKYKEDGPTGNATYPWFVAWCGDLDITGHRRPVSFYREIVYGLRKEPYAAVRYPKNYGKTPQKGGWDFVDGIASWTWPGLEGKPVELEVYGPGDKARVYINKKKIAEVPLSEYRGNVEIIFEPGELKIVCIEGDSELGCFEMQTARADEIILSATADRSIINSGDGDLAYIDIELTDNKGVVHTDIERNVTVNVEGAGFLAGLGSADPMSEEDFLHDSHSTFEGRAQAVIRPLGEGEIKITISAQGCDPVDLTINCIS